MKRHYVESSAIKTIGYDAKRKILEIEFHNGGAVWQYHQFKKPMYNEFMDAKSKGNFFVTQIKGRHPETQVN